MFVLKALVLSFVAIGFSDGAMQTTLYSSPDCSGGALKVSEDIPDLSLVGFNDIAQSRYEDGVWLFYENGNYNAAGGYTLLTWAIRYCSNFEDLSNEVSSVRYAGRLDSYNAETISLYEGFFMTGQEYWADSEAADLGGFNDKATSVIITGQSPWTLYSDQYFGGMTMCIYPDNYIVASPDRIDLGYQGDLAPYGFGKSVSSFKKGCFSENVVKVSGPAPVKSTVEEGKVELMFRHI